MGKVVRANIGHTLLTDIAEFSFGHLVSPSRPELVSLQAAITEGAARALAIRRTEIDGTFYLDGLEPVFVIFDTVPGGAGLAKRVFDGARAALEAALDVVTSCVCGEGSSCYACLRNYNNQHDHRELDRSAAARLLERVVQVEGARAIPSGGGG
jgi:ATP-dependent helicase YprA (DUF1998 family)